MPTMTYRAEVAANGKNSGIFQGQLHEYVARRSIVRLYATAEAIGMKISVNNGFEQIVNDQEVNAQNRLPVRPDDLFTEYVSPAGGRIVVDFRNTTATAIDAFCVVDIIPA
jgi:hypothetical protein